MILLASRESPPLSLLALPPGLRVRGPFLMKCDEDIKVHVSSTLKADLRRIAEKRDRDLSDYVRHVLTRHVIVERALAGTEGADGAH